MTWYTAPTLSGSRIMLRELVSGDAPALAAAVDRPEAFRWTTVPGDVAAAERYIQTALDTPDRVAFAVVEQDSGRVVGSTSYYDITPDYRALAIGHTWYSAAVHGTAVNPEAKLLLLRRAFEDLSASEWCGIPMNATPNRGRASPNSAPRSKVCCASTVHFPMDHGAPQRNTR